MDSQGFQFDYVGYLKNMVFLIVLLAAMSYTLIKLKSGKERPKFSLLNLGQPHHQTQYIEVLEKTSLDGRKSLYLVKIFENQYWLLGTTESSIEMLGKVKPSGYTTASVQGGKTE